MLECNLEIAVRFDICDVCSHWNFTNLVLDQLDYLKGDTTVVAFCDVDIYSVCKRSLFSFVQSVYKGSKRTKTPMCIARRHA